LAKELNLSFYMINHNVFKTWWYNKQLNKFINMLKQMFVFG
jgi:hypothetical protein